MECKEKPGEGSGRIMSFFGSENLHVWCKKGSGEDKKRRARGWKGKIVGSRGKSLRESR